MKTKKLLLICSTVLSSIIILSTFIFSVVVMINAFKIGTPTQSLTDLINLQLEVYIPIFTIYAGIFVYECIIYQKRERIENEIIANKK